MLQYHTAYMSHSIRGRLGLDATPKSMMANNGKAHEAAVLIRCILPEVSIYVPGENDLLISILYQDGRLKEEDILWGDCEIIRLRDILLVWSPDDFISTGMQIEINFATKENIPVFVIHTVEEVQALKPIILSYLREKDSE
ncbi:hypothetical protein LCGC14_0487100 [marine sediment metagenome]|uniref:Uncharacterized protein n=1 Tax=marine sediment metagenome TaxID=412755 RepID=A0A0F9UUM8_9ZZZZ